MKRKSLYIVAAFVLVAATLGACQKSRYCRCIATTDNVSDTVIVNVDRSMKCEHILSMGTEATQDGEVVTSVRDVTCTKIHKDTVPTIPNLPRED